MPVTWGQATFDAMYQRGGQPSYRRSILGQSEMWQTRVDRLTSLFPIGQSDRIMIGGCGFGWTIERFHDSGYPNVWGMEISPYVSANRGVESRGDITLVEEDLRGFAGGRVRGELRRLTGDDQFDWIITEAMLEGYDPVADTADLDDIFLACELGLLGSDLGHIIHMIVPLGAGSNQDPSLTWMTIDEWKAIRPAHTWVTYTDWQVR